MQPSVAIVKCAVWSQPTRHCGPSLQVPGLRLIGRSAFDRSCRANARLTVLIELIQAKLHGSLNKAISTCGPAGLDTSSARHAVTYPSCVCSVEIAQLTPLLQRERTDGATAFATSVRRERHHARTCHARGMDQQSSSISQTSLAQTCKCKSYAQPGCDHARASLVHTIETDVHEHTVRVRSGTRYNLRAASLYPPSKGSQFSKPTAKNEPNVSPSGSQAMTTVSEKRMGERGKRATACLA